MLEIYVLLGTFLLLVVIGALSAISESHSQRKESKWAFPPATSVENAKKTIQPIDEASRYLSANVANNTNNKIEVSDVLLEDNSVIYKQIVINEDLEGFTHSEITDEVNDNLHQIVNSINLEVNEYTENCNESQLNNEVKGKITELIGEKTAGLVTNLLTDLRENELSVVMGLYNSATHSINFEGASLKLSITKPIISGEDDYILFKGTLLPNGEFRVIHSDDAETVEHGYGIESFVIKKTA